MAQKLVALQYSLCKDNFVCLFGWDRALVSTHETHKHTLRRIIFPSVVSKHSRIQFRSPIQKEKLTKAVASPWDRAFIDVCSDRWRWGDSRTDRLLRSGTGLNSSPSRTPCSHHVGCRPALILKGLTGRGERRVLEVCREEPHRGTRWCPQSVSHQ